MRFRRLIVLEQTGLFKMLLAVKLYADTQFWKKKVKRKRLVPTAVDKPLLRFVGNAVKLKPFSDSPLAFRLPSGAGAALRFTGVQEAVERSRKLLTAAASKPQLLMRVVLLLGKELRAKSVGDHRHLGDGMRLIPRP